MCWRSLESTPIRGIFASGGAPLASGRHSERPQYYWCQSKREISPGQRGDDKGNDSTQRKASQ
jgi:hypothetical protein